MNHARSLAFLALFAVVCTGIELLAMGCTGVDVPLSAPESNAPETGLPDEPSVPEVGVDGGYVVSTLAGTGKWGGTDGPGLEATFNLPSGIVIGSDGDLYVADTNSNMIRKVAVVDGTVSTYAGKGEPGVTDGPCANATFNNPYGIAVDKDGNFYVTDIAGNAIRKITRTPTCQVSTLAGGGDAGDSDGKGSLASFSSPLGLTLDTTSGNIYVVEEDNHKIRMVDPDGNVTTIAGTGVPGNTNGQALSATFNGPQGVVYVNGDLYVTEHSDIRKIADNWVTTLAGSSDAGLVIDGTGTKAAFNAPEGVTIANGNLLVGDCGNNAVRRVTLDGEVTTIAGTGIADAVDGPADTATFNCPVGVVMDPSGVIYVADQGSNKIRKIARQ
ncbi:MAG: hypothetical protein FWD69_05800 [Polyangiaceae bacterium]|nr:hypothetical protein [Polyangiaceae bacterium]